MHFALSKNLRADNNYSRKLSTFFIALFLFLTACSLPNPTSDSSQEQAEILVQRPTQAGEPTMTETVEKTAVFSPTPTAHNTIPLQPSHTPTNVPPSATPLLPTLQPPATPAGPLDTYQLKQWTEQEALAAIAEARGALSDLHIAETYGNNGPDQLAYNALVEKEALLRFPELPNWSEIAWDLTRIAYNPIVPIDTYDADLLPQLLETALNTGETQLSDLNEYLQSYHFYLSASQPAYNLLGHQESATLLLITSFEWGGPFEKGILLLVTGSQPSEYRVVVVEKVGGIHPRYEVLPVADYNSNGSAEIGLISLSYDSGIPAPCQANFSLWEWQENDTQGRFVNLVPDVEGFTTSSDKSSCEDLWHFAADADQKAAALVERRQYITGDGCPTLVRKITYTWDGSQYAWNTSEIEPLPDNTATVCAVQWADKADETNTQAITILETALADWPVAMDELWGPASADYFRLKLGMWYDLRQRPDLALQFIQAVRDNPVYAESDLVPDMTRAYLGARQTYGVFSACDAANQILSTKLADIPWVDYGHDLTIMREMWGVADPKWWAYEPDPICDNRAAFRADIQQLTPTDDQQTIAAWLNGTGVPWTAVYQADVNNDGLHDWLVLANFSSHPSSWDLWAFMQNDTGYTPVSITQFSTKVRPTAITYHGVSLSAEPGDVNIVVADNSLTVFKLVPQEDGWQVHNLLVSYFWGKTAVTDVHLNENGADISLIIDTDDVETQYTWSPDNNVFTYASSNSPTQSEQIRRIERLIWQQANYPEAITQLQALLAEDIEESHYYPADSTVIEPAHIEPYLRYLLGLCYELSGDADSAAATYWQLWQDFPTNLRTLIVRRKLQVIN